MSSLYVTEAGSFIKRNGGHVVVGRNNEVLFEVPLERIEDITVFDTVSITSSLVTDFIERGYLLLGYLGMENILVLSLIRIPLILINIRNNLIC